MPKKNWSWKTILKWLWDFWEKTIPAVVFLFFFGIFVYQIIMRYVFRDPVRWSFELTLFMYIFIILIGSANAERTDDHVVFSMIYDGRKPKTQVWMRIITALLILTGFGICLPYMFNYAWLIKIARIKTTPVLKIPYRYLYICFVYMIVSIMAQRFVGMLRDIRVLVTMGKKKDIVPESVPEKGGNSR